jgi:hypothetical protein
VLAESFRQHNPGHAFVVLVIDDLAGDFDTGGSFETLTPQQVGIDAAELHRRGTMFTPHGLAVSAKPDLIRYLLSDDEPVILLDADSCVYGDLTPIGDLAHRHSLVLSPHPLDPHPLYEQDGVEQVCLRHGVMNSGFLAAAKGSEAFLDWWRERTARRSVIDLPRGLFTDQGWLTVATGIFEHHVLRDRGCNVMGWNLQSRDVEWRGDLPFIDGQPLRHFHFINGFDPRRPHLLAPFQEDPELWVTKLWPSLEQRPGVARICREYAARLLAAGYRESRRQRVRFTAMPGGRPLEQWMRELYRLALIRSEAGNDDEPPNPFTHGSERFLDWLGSAEPLTDSSPEARAAAAEAEAQRLRERVGELTGSRSWRLTRPLRSLVSAFSRRS